MTAEQHPASTFFDHLSRYVLLTNLLKFGDRYASFTMHKPLEVPGHLKDRYNRSTRLNYINDVALQGMGLQSDPLILDVGCGFGGTIFRWQEEIGGRYEGISLSRTQIAIAERESRRRGIDKDCQFYIKNFDEPLKDLYDVIVTIESLNFSLNPEETVRNLMGALKPGGKWVWVDDILIRNVAENLEDIQTLKQHWHLTGLLTERIFHRILNKHKLTVIREEDLSNLFHPIGTWSLKWGEKAAKMLHRITPIGFFRSILSSYLGGIALQKLYRKGVVRYKLVVSQK